MSEVGLPVLYALFVWWFCTGLIVWLDGLPRRTFRWSLAGAGLLAAAALAALVAVRDEATAEGAFVAFTAAVVLWGWHEMSFLMGFVTGPNRAPAPPGIGGLRRFLCATGTVIWHELAIAATALLLLALAAGTANPFGAWTFAALWAMRLSAKLNLFLGVRNLAEEFLPPHLAYLASHFRRRRMNGLFPVSVTAGTLAAVLLALAAGHPGATPAEATGFVLLSTLTALAVVEHWFLVLPLPSTALWSWFLALRPSAAAPSHWRQS